MRISNNQFSTEKRNALNTAYLMLCNRFYSKEDISTHISVKSEEMSQIIDEIACRFPMVIDDLGRYKIATEKTSIELIDQTRKLLFEEVEILEKKIKQLTILRKTIDNT